MGWDGKLRAKLYPWRNVLGLIKRQNLTTARIATCRQPEVRSSGKSHPYDHARFVRLEGRHSRTCVSSDRGEDRKMDAQSRTGSTCSSRHKIEQDHHPDSKIRMSIILKVTAGVPSARTLIQSAWCLRYPLDLITGFDATGTVNLQLNLASHDAIAAGHGDIARFESRVRVEKQHVSAASLAQPVRLESFELQFPYSSDYLNEY